jgi:organic radical activating enzyme
MLLNNVNIVVNNISEAGVKGYNLATFSWFVTNICQYRCEYCSVTPWLLQKTFANKYHDVYKTVLKILSLKRMIPFDIEVEGGEPTLHPDILNILHALNKIDKCQKIQLHTNIAKPLSFFKQLDKPEYNKLEISPSYHPEYHKKDKYVKKLIALNDLKHVTSHPNITASDNKKYWKETIAILEELKQNNVPYGINILHEIDNFYKPDYCDEFYEVFNPYIQSTIASTDKVPYIIDGKRHEFDELQIHTQQLYKFKGFYCTALMWKIDVDGHITNYCTGEPLNILATNIDKRVKCPGPKPCGGCLDPLQYYFHKTRDE